MAFSKLTRGTNRRNFILGNLFLAIMERTIRLDGCPSRSCHFSMDAFLQLELPWLRLLLEVDRVHL